jgi:hypothetical protein
VVEGLASGKVSWTLSSLLTPLAFVASSVKTDHSKQGQPGIIDSPKRHRHITATRKRFLGLPVFLLDAVSVGSGGSRHTYRFRPVVDYGRPVKRVTSLRH